MWIVRQELWRAQAVELRWSVGGLRQTIRGPERESVGPIVECCALLQRVAVAPEEIRGG